MNIPCEVRAVRARAIVPMTGEKASRGRELSAPLRIIDDGVLVMSKKRVVECGRKKDIVLPRGCQLNDLGDVCLIPGVINCHAHIDISHLAGKTLWGRGFSAWLTSLIPLGPRKTAFDRNVVDSARRDAIISCARNGTACVASICSPLLSTLLDLEREANKQGLALLHFLEVFGTQSEIFSGCMRDMREHCPEALLGSAGHALYSVEESTLLQARTMAAACGRRMSLHLAESAEEEEMLACGKGPLFEIFSKGVLPPSWKPPFLRPVALAHALGLLSNLLAVHCVHVSKEEAALLASNDVAICLCPRSNDSLAVGEAPFDDFVRNGLLLCLGTDGLTSSPDLNVVNEASFLREKKDIPAEALVRMLTVNGAYALGLPDGFARLEPGSPAAFALVPDCLSVA